MVNLQKSIKIISLLSILIFLPSLAHAQSLTELDRQLEQENLEKIKQLKEIQKQNDFDKLTCPQGAYYGLDNQGNDVCKDILTNQIVDSEIRIIPDSGKDVVANPGRGLFADSGRATFAESDREIISDPVTAQIIVNDNQTNYVGIGILSLIGITTGVVALGRNKIYSTLLQMRGWSQEQKEQVRSNQYGICNICYTKPTRWVYDHIDGDKRNNDISNCQGLCPKCKSEKMMIKI